MSKRIDYKLIAIFLFVAIIFFASAPLWAGDDYRGNNDPSNVNVDVGGSTINVQGGDLTGGPVNVSTGGNRSFAIGIPGLGDVDIAGCLGSEQWTLLVGGKQKLVINWVCLTEFYLRNGQPELAAQALCNTEVVKEYATEEECEEAHGFFADVVLAMAVKDSKEEDEEEEYHEEQMQMYEDMQAKIRNLEAELAKPKPVPRPVQKTVVEQKPLLTAEQRAALLEIKK